MSTKQLLEILVKQLLDVEFILPGAEPQVREIPTEVSEIEFHFDEIGHLLNHYYAFKDESKIHIYRYSPEDCVIFIAETQEFLDKKSWGIIEDTYEKACLLFEKEYDAVRKEISQSFGTPTYINDEYSDFVYEHRKTYNESWKRRDIPLEFQMVDHMGAYRLTYWIVNKRVLYLTLAHMDREEPLNIALGIRPIIND